MSEPIKPTVLPEDWPEDFAHENGCYMNRCCVCSREFRGHKRRATCKACTVTEPIKQPEALRLADALGLYYTHLTAVPDINREAAAELRRLHAEVEGLRAVISNAAHKLEQQRVWGGMDWAYPAMPPRVWRAVLEQLDATLKEPTP